MEHRETGDKFTFIESTTGEIVTVRANVLMRIGMFIDICDGERYFVTLNYQTAEKAKKALEEFRKFYRHGKDESGKELKVNSRLLLVDTRPETNIDS